LKTETLIPTGDGGSMPSFELHVPEPVAVELDPRDTALLVMDITDPLCLKRPSCVASVPLIASLITRARASGTPVIYTIGPKRPTLILNEVAPAGAEPVIPGRADKFYKTDLHGVLRGAGVSTLVIVGTAANGAVLYSSFAANLRGYAVVVAADAISAESEIVERAVRWQLLNQPGYTNPENDPLMPERVTLSAVELIRFRQPADNADA
jgi:nicotinamidase-related amidase